jgi:death-on-curing protein
VTEPAWIAIEVVLAIQDAQLAEHGGSAGVRDRTLLESALARPRNIYLYSENVTLNQLAAAYAVGLAKNHAFVDGNKRVGWIACAVFLAVNGVTVVSQPAQVVQMMLGVARGDINEEALALWLDTDHPEGARSLR